MVTALTSSPDSADKPAALIFRKRLLPWSETFIAAQGGTLERYRPVFVGYRFLRDGAAYLEGHDCVVLAEHALVPGLAKGAYKALGVVPHRWRRALEARRPALLHAHFGVNGFAALPLVRALDIPLVVTYHGMDIAIQKGHAREHRERSRVFTAADRIIAVSQFIAARLRDAGCPPEKIVVHHIGVDTERFTPGHATDRAAAQILFVGRLVPKKGLAHLLRAMPHVQRAVPEAELIVAGDGPLRAELEAEANHLGARVRFLGVQPPDRIRELMRRATLLCSPSVVAADGNAEGLPMTIVEAQASGLPVVAFPSGGSAEGIVHGETGFIVPPADEDALADHLVELLRNADQRTRFSSAARSHAVRNFDLRNQTAKLERIYDEVRGRRGD